MLDEVLEVMGPRSGGVYCDVTVGLAGHALAILDASSPDGRLVGLDRDPDALEIARHRLEKRAPGRWSVHHRVFSDLGSTRGEQGLPPFDGILADLGVSSMQIDDPARGFSFRRDGPVDMRMDPTSPRSARDLLGGSTETELCRILEELGEERHARRVARAIRRAQREGRIASTAELAHVVRTAVGRARSGGVDSATRSFQAIRMAVNREIEELDALLDGLLENLAEDGVFVCLSYHSLEDGRVKRALRELARRGAGEILTKKPRVPSREETRNNRRARSAKLRAFRRTCGEA